MTGTFHNAGYSELLNFWFTCFLFLNYESEVSPYAVYIFGYIVCLKNYVMVCGFRDNSWLLLSYFFVLTCWFKIHICSSCLILEVLISACFILLDFLLLGCLCNYLGRFHLSGWLQCSLVFSEYWQVFFIHMWVVFFLVSEFLVVKGTVPFFLTAFCSVWLLKLYVRWYLPKLWPLGDWLVKKYSKAAEKV